MGFRISPRKIRIFREERITYLSRLFGVLFVNISSRRSRAHETKTAKKRPVVVGCTAHQWGPKRRFPKISVKKGERRRQLFSVSSGLRLVSVSIGTQPASKRALVVKRFTKRISTPLSSFRLSLRTGGFGFQRGECPLARICTPPNFGGRCQRFIR